jgi:hypothetical protein
MHPAAASNKKKARLFSRPSMNKLISRDQSLRMPTTCFSSIINVLIPAFL